MNTTDDKFYRPRITRRVDLAPDLWMIRIDPGGEFKFVPGNTPPWVWKDRRSAGNVPIQSYLRPMRANWSFSSNSYPTATCGWRIDTEAVKRLDSRNGLR
jgi:hypothetical protein